MHRFWRCARWCGWLPQVPCPCEPAHVPSLPTDWSALGARLVNGEGFALRSHPAAEILPRSPPGWPRRSLGFSDHRLDSDGRGHRLERQDRTAMGASIVVTSEEGASYAN